MLHAPNDPALSPDPRLARWVREAVADLEQRARSELPESGAALVAWLASLSPAGDIAGYYLHPIAFPMLRFALWLDEELDGSVDAELQSAIAHSTVAGYAFIRLIDDVMDHSPRARAELLPALAFFHARFEAPYRELLADDPSFWAEHARIWSGAADAAIADGVMTDIDAASFLRVAAAKVDAGRIPLLAVARRHGLGAIPGTWQRVHARMGAFHQMYNDLFDWADDLARDGRTYILCEARRRASEHGVPGWIAREGVTWASALMDDWMDEMQLHASVLRGSALQTYLEARARHFHGMLEEIAPGLRAIVALETLAHSAPGVAP